MASRGRRAKGAGRKKGGRKKPAWDVSELPEPNAPEAERPATWHARAVQLLGVFNQCVQRANEGSRIQARVRRANRVNTEIMWGLDRFCHGLGAEAASWIVTVFEASGYKAPPRQASLFSPKWKEHYDTRYSRTFADAGNLVLAQQQSRGFEPFVDLYQGAELVKRRYRLQGKEDLCMNNMDLTYGFHVRSAECAECPRRPECVNVTARRAQEYRTL